MAAFKKRISSEALEKLENAFASGLTSVSKSTQHRVDSVASAAELTSQQVKDWIGNKKRKLSGRQYARVSNFKKHGTSYNLFCKEQSDNGIKDMKSWSNNWKSLTENQRDTYGQRAKQTVPIKSRPKSEKKKISSVLLKQLDALLQKLSDCDIDIAAIGYSSDKLFITGNGKMNDYFSSESVKASIIRHFSSETSSKELNESNPEKLSVLQARAREHFNKLYAKATNSNRKFPYKGLQSGRVMMKGIPEILIPLAPPSHCGREKLLKMISVEEIIVDQPALKNTVDEPLLNKQITPIPDIIVDQPPPENAVDQPMTFETSTIKEPLFNEPSTSILSNRSVTPTIYIDQDGKVQIVVKKS